MIRAAPWEVLGTSAAADGARQEQWLRAHPPSHRSASCNAGAWPTIQRSRRDRDNEAVLREPFTPNGGLVVQSGARSLRHRDAIISLAARYKLPAVYSARDSVIWA